MMEPHEAERRPKWLGICGKGAVACLLFFPKCGLKAPVWLRPGSAAWPRDWQPEAASVGALTGVSPQVLHFYFHLPTLRMFPKEVRQELGTEETLSSLLGTSQA